MISTGKRRPRSLVHLRKRSRPNRTMSTSAPGDPTSISAPTPPFGTRSRALQPRSTARVWKNWSARTSTSSDAPGAGVQVQILEQRDQRSVSLLHSFVFRLYCGVAFPEGDNRGGGCGDEQCDEYRDGGADEAPGASLLVEVLADQFFHTLAVDRGCKARDRVPKGGVGAEIDVGSPGAEVDIVRFGRE